jgi:acetoin utilization protein AcuC
VVSQPASSPAPTCKASLIASSRFRRHSYGANHPLGIPRVSLTLDLIHSYGALTPGERVEARAATPRELEAFHSRAYVSAMQRCEALGKVLDRYRRAHNIGNFENPWFPGFFRIPAAAAGASIQGAEQVLAGRIAFNPAGGMHHATADGARGFCFFNDAVLGILRLRRAGLRVLYVDIDAHHGDGVEQAFRDDPGVMTFSVHMDTAYAYPHAGGGLADSGSLGNAVNLPLPAGINDTEYRHAFETAWPAVRQASRADAVVLQAGTDMLMPDPLGKFRTSTQLFLEVVARIHADCPSHPDGTPRLLVIGGGGYHPLALARCWTGVWGVLSGRCLPGAIPHAGRDLLRAVEWELDEDASHYPGLFLSRLDSPCEGPIRPEVRTRVTQLLTEHPRLAAVQPPPTCKEVS